jgi:hypothetical protein
MVGVNPFKAARAIGLIDSRESDPALKFREKELPFLGEELPFLRGPDS